MSLVALASLACKPTETDDDGEHPATPIEAEDAPTQLAEQICAQLFECSCASGYADEASCVETQSQLIAARIDTVLDAGGSWDPACAGQLAKTLHEWACLAPTMASQASAFDSRSCPLLRGTVAAGMDCSHDVLGDDCADGLMCIAGVCVTPPTLPVPRGELCNYDWETLPCESGSYCGWDDNYEQRICRALPKAGDACTEYLCGPQANDLICEANTCVPAPGAGEPCFDGYLCGPGTYCDGGQDFTCQPRREIGDGCGADTVCPVDASCVGNICEADPAAVCSAPNWFY